MKISTRVLIIGLFAEVLFVAGIAVWLNFSYGLVAHSTLIDKALYVVDNNSFRLLLSKGDTITVKINVSGGKPMNFLISDGKTIQYSQLINNSSLDYAWTVSDEANYVFSFVRASNDGGALIEVKLWSQYDLENKIRLMQNLSLFFIFTSVISIATTIYLASKKLFYQEEIRRVLEKARKESKAHMS